MQRPEIPSNLPTPESLRAQVDDMRDSAFEGLMTELDKAMEGLPATQEKLMSLTGVAWSEDRLVRAVVGPRGQLVELEIDPRVFRSPDAAQLQATILSTTQAAVTELNAQIAEIVGSQVPPEVSELRARFQPDESDPMAQLLMSDAEIVARRRSEDDGDMG